MPKVTRTNILIPVQRSCCNMCNMKALLLWRMFFFCQQMSRSKGLVQTKRSYYKECSYEIWKLWHLLFKSFWQGWSCQNIGQTPKSRSRVKNVGMRGKVLSQEILVWNIKALVLTVQKVLARLKFSKNRPNSKVKVTGLEIFVLMERSCQKEHLYDVSILKALMVEKLLAGLG